MLDVRVHDIRSFTTDKHHQVDDSSFGGGPGMVMKPEPVFAAVESLDPDRGRVILLSPAGRRLDQALVRELAAETAPDLDRGRYEGVDERVVTDLPAEELSIGDYVVSGGEMPALVVIEAVTRLVPGVIGREESHEQDSFSRERELDHPHYTRPREFRGIAVPDVLGVGQPRRDRALATRGRTGEGSPQPSRPRPRRRPTSLAKWASAALVSSSTVAMNTTDLIEQAYLRSDIPDFRPGDTVKVNVRVVEGNRERVQAFQGVVIRRQGGSVRETFTVRKISFGVGRGAHVPGPLAVDRLARARVAGAPFVAPSSTTCATCAARKARIKERRIDDAKLAAMEEAAALAAAEAADDEDVEPTTKRDVETDVDDRGLEAPRTRRRPTPRPTRTPPARRPGPPTTTPIAEAEEKAEA